MRIVSTAHPNNGMHPTADTLLLKFLQWLVAAGDAGRYIARKRRTETGSVSARRSEAV
jgi:hypothetical protein